VVAKEDDLTPAHLGWLVSSRTANQQAALKLFTLFEKYPKQMKSAQFSSKAELMVAACFSLWRAAFLADKTGARHAVINDAKTFLGKMLTDNAITYPQDRSAREWTFNYYMNNAMNCLVHLGQEWGEVEAVLSAEQKVTKGTTKPSRRWDRHQEAFNIALGCLEDALKKTQGIASTPKASRKQRTQVESDEGDRA